MDCLEFGNLHQLIFAELANNIAESKEDDDIQPVLDLVRNSVQSTRESHQHTEDEKDEEVVRKGIFMPASRVHCHVGFAQIAINVPKSHVGDSFPILLDILNDIPNMDFDETLMWDRWALPDQLTYSSVTALLRLASLYPHLRNDATAAIIQFTSRTIAQLTKESATMVITQYAPTFHGLYRAIISSPFAWSSKEWTMIVEHLKVLFLPDTVDRLNNLLPQSTRETENDASETRYVQIFLSRYVARDRQISGYFLVCCVIEIIWTILAQALSPAPAQTTSTNEQAVVEDEAAAANDVWLRLTRIPCEGLEDLECARDRLRNVSSNAMRCFEDILAQIQDMDTEPSLETYAWETMSECLKLSSICTIALQEHNEELVAKLKQLLSEESPISDNLLQEAALKSTTIIVLNFPSLAFMMSGHLRRFVTSPLPMFDYEFAPETNAPPPLVAAAKCLSVCIKLAPSGDFIMSNMYSLLNYISATNKDPHDNSLSSRDSNLSMEGEQSTIESLKTGLISLDEDQQRLIGLSTISVVTCLAVEFKSEEVTRLTVSMLLQRLRTAEPSVEASIVYNLADLALIAPENTFVDIIKSFSVINRSANPDDPRFSNNTIIAAQTRLAQELRKRPDFRQLYLVELLELFIDKGVAIQNAIVWNQLLKADDLIDQLGSILLPIDALLSQKDFLPNVQDQPVLLALFRNVWFLCILFQFTNPEDRGSPSSEWQIAALTRIAVKTPDIVLEEVPDFVSNTLEFNTIVRREYAQTVINKHRALLSKQLPLRHGEIRHLSPTQIIFLLTMLDIETMRSSVGHPSRLPTYFINGSVNGHVGLSTCMDNIADKVIQIAVDELSRKVIEHTLPESVLQELLQLLVASCHRISKVRDVAGKYLNRLITAFPSLMCDSPLVNAILEVLSMLRRACEGEHMDEFDPVFQFHSEVSDITLYLSDSYKTRNDILSRLQSHANTWFSLALTRAPVEFQATLQKYLVNYRTAVAGSSAELGASVALQFATTISPAERKQVSGGINARPDRAKVFANQIASKERYNGEASGVRLSIKEDIVSPAQLTQSLVHNLKVEISVKIHEVQMKSAHFSVTDVKKLLFRCASALIHRREMDGELIRDIVALPFEVFGPSIVSAGVEAWTWVIAERPDLEFAILSEVGQAWSKIIEDRNGLFSDAINYSDPFAHSVEYTPTNKAIIDRGISAARKLLTPHVLLLQMLLSRFQAARYRKPGLMHFLLRLVLRTARAHKHMSTHPLAREARFSFLIFGFEALKSSRMDSYCEKELREALYSAAYSWFAVRPQWSYGADRVQVEADIKIMLDLLTLLEMDKPGDSHVVSSSSTIVRKNDSRDLRSANHLLRLLIENEIYRLTVWDNPSNDQKRRADHSGMTMSEESWATEIRAAWKIDPAIVIYLPERFKNLSVERDARRYIRSNPQAVLDHPDALKYVIGENRLETPMQRDLKYVLLSAAVTPVTAVGYFEPRYRNDPFLLQFAYRVLEEHDVGVTFFFVPQVVQSLRNDSYGYVKRFMLDTAKISQLFCHQIIWNMKANCYKDDSASIEDSMKPQLDEMIDLIVGSLSGEAKEFYDREFGFFHEVTSISGKLKPFIKKTKPEKKAKIDEEMAKIHVEVGVYLPSNPDGIVVDIDRKSGRPLQSHAKAPFMASFKVRKEKLILSDISESVLGDEGLEARERMEEDVWQAAIFKVGDDCRQDVLALQVIAMFKNIFTSIGLNLYLFPYRVTATGPGCGVIDVIPNAISQDEIRRQKVNDLLGFFAANYGGEDSIEFQRARLNFIHSMAGYSVACYILQIKDRHNGNIMIDSKGHIIHIGPGGIKFEPNSFKLNHEMVVLMGGRYSQGYGLFQQLTVKAFLAIRPYAEQIISTVELMLGTDLPSFKGEGTIKRLRDRFALGLNERQAADWMMAIIKNAHENVRSVAYDEFQRVQNGIPYK